MVCVLDKIPLDTVKNSEGQHYIYLDVTDFQMVEVALKKAVEMFGEMRGLVVTAGITSAATVISRDSLPMDMDTAKAMIQVNLLGTMNCLVAASTLMSKNVRDSFSERGVIVTVGSIASRDTQGGTSVYAGTKAGVSTFTRVAARDLRRWGIRCICVAPGAFNTPMTSSLSKATQKRIESGFGFPARSGDPDEFAALVSHILANHFINGSVLEIDGGGRLL